MKKICLTDIRLRNTIEIRAIDGQTFEHIPSACAFWTGLVYHQPSLESLWKLFQNRTLEDYQTAQAEVCVHGLKAKYGKDSVQELAIERDFRCIRKSECFSKGD